MFLSRRVCCSRDLNKTVCLIGEADLSRRESLFDNKIISIHQVTLSLTNSRSEGFLRERGLVKNSVQFSFAFLFANETEFWNHLFPLSGVSLVRFFSPQKRNEQKTNSPLNINLIINYSTPGYFPNIAECKNAT